LNTQIPASLWFVSRNKANGKFRNRVDEVLFIDARNMGLTPGRYVGLPEEEDDFNFEERFTSLKKEFTEQLKEEERLNALILENLARVVIGDGNDR